MDRISIIGLIIGLSAILLGQMIEGGSVLSLVQPTALVIVFGVRVGRGRRAALKAEREDRRIAASARTVDYAPAALIHPTPGHDSGTRTTLP